MNKIIRKTLAIASCFLLVLFLSCASSKSSAHGGKKYFISFFSGTDGMLYFIKPLLFKALNSNDYLNVDITYRFKDELKDSARLNFSIVQQKALRKIDSIVISNKMIAVSINSNKYLFSEKNSAGVENRFSLKTPLSGFKKLLENNDWTVSIYNQGTVKNYMPSRKTKSILISLKENLMLNE